MLAHTEHFFLRGRIYGTNAGGKKGNTRPAHHIRFWLALARPSLALLFAQQAQGKKRKYTRIFVIHNKYMAKLSMDS